MASYLQFHNILGQPNCSSRFSRDLYEQELAYSRLAKDGFKLVSTTNGGDLEDSPQSGGNLMDLKELGFEEVIEIGNDFGAPKQYSLKLTKTYQVSLGEEIIDKFKLEEGCVLKTVKRKNKSGQEEVVEQKEPTHSVSIGWMNQTEKIEKNKKGEPFKDQMGNPITRTQVISRKLAIQFVENGNGKGKLPLERTSKGSFSFSMKELIDPNEYEGIDSIWNYQYQDKAVEYRMNLNALILDVKSSKYREKLDKASNGSEGTSTTKDKPKIGQPQVKKATIV